MEPGIIVGILSVAGALAGVLIGWFGYRRTVRRDLYEEGGRNGSIRSDIEYIKRRTDDTLIEVKETNKGLQSLTERVTRVEESAKQAHKRLDHIEMKGE